MLTTYFGEFTTGRLARLPWLGYYLGLIVVMLLIGIGIGAGIGLTQNLIGGDPAESQQAIENAIGEAGPLLLFILLLVGLVLGLAGLNINAKRLRDMGLPGWLSLLGIAVVAMAVSALLGEGAANMLGFILFLGMLLTPSDAFARGG